MPVCIYIARSLLPFHLSHLEHISLLMVKNRDKLYHICNLDLYIKWVESQM